MAFLDNSGDIILDAVLTDTGRFRLAKGDGSFKIAKFALGDDEINYAVYDSNHASGSAYYDLEILQTSVEDEKGNVSSYQIVGEHESDIENKKLSVNSPLARGLIGKIKDDDVEINSPKGIKTYTIISVNYIWKK